VAGDSNASMQLAAAAIKKGDFTRAGQIYQALATRNPNDSEALSGIGDVARLSGNPMGAIAAYRRAIAVNPSYLPALLGLADTEWATGDRAAALHEYGDIVDRFPEGTYPAYVSKRIGAAGNAPAAEPPSETKPPSATTAPAEHTE
jgi:tetratricopeptide (TPR) repeat protein